MKKEGKIITVFSTKGGVGKTHLAINLAGLYHEMGKKVLLVDFDLYSGGIAVYLNVDVKKTIYNLVDDIDNKRYTEFSKYVSKYNDNIDVLACPIDPRKGNKIDSKYVDIVLGSASSNYDIVLVDTSHILSDINLSALDISDEILMIVSNDPLDLKNMKSMIAIFKETDIDNYYVVLNESINTEKDVFSIFDIKNIIKNNIDYTISKKFHIKDIDHYVLNGEIPILNKSIKSKKREDIDNLKKLTSRLIKNRGGNSND